MLRKPRILVCPLNWGLGHAARCIPVIKELLDENCEVIVGANGTALDLLKRTFPDLEFIKVPGADISYGASGFDHWNKLKTMIAFGKSIKKENKILPQLIADHKIDVIVSDNRYGLYSKQAYSVIITHQLYIKLPAPFSLFSNILQRIIHNYINRFNECLVPDANGVLSGELSSPLPRKYSFAGLLSRFKQCKSAVEDFVLVILSGPEPQRSILEGIMEKKLEAHGCNAIVVRGRPGKNGETVKGKIKMIDHVDTDHLNRMICSARYIISRSGYSTIMDLAAAGRAALIIPTPGQTEQEYLAQYHHEKKHHVSQLQNQINLPEAFNKLDQIQPLYIHAEHRFLSASLLNVIQNLKKTS